MPAQASNFYKEKIEDYKVLWKRLKTDQKISLTAMLFLLLILPLGVILSISPIQSLTGLASFPATPPAITPITPPTMTPTVTVTPPPGQQSVTINEPFLGHGALDLSKWGWSGSVGSSVSLEYDKLMITIPQGSEGNLSKSAVVFPYINSQIVYLAGDFEAEVELLDVIVNGQFGSQGLNYGTRTLLIQRRSDGTNEYIEALTGNVQTGSSTIVVGSVTLPLDSGAVRVKMVRTGQLVTAYYNLGNGFISLASVQADLNDSYQFPSLVVKNYSPSYPGMYAYFSYYFAKGNILVNQIPTSTPTIRPPTPTLRITPTITIPPTPTFTPTPTPAPPADNLAPSISTFNFKSGRVGRYMERKMQATDRNGDRITMSASNLPPGLSFGDCSFRVRDNKRSLLECSVSGFPSQAGIYTAKFTATDQWGLEAVKYIYFTILP